MTLPERKGSYALILYLAKRATVRVGRLGNTRFLKGYYVYVGSALGPGGLSARLHRHLAAEKKLHWHIDYLGKIAKIKEIWICEDVHRQEHRWAAIFSGLEGAVVPVKGFGSSDCRCPAHLFHLNQKPSIEPFRRALAGDQEQGHPIVAVPIK